MTNKKTTTRKSKAPSLGTVEIQRIKLSQVKAAGYNPREISKEALAGLAQSVERFGCVEPIVWNK